ncbi:MAG: hypothetical protein ACR2PS_08830 [Pseudomonadales bacterium]
MQKTTSAVLAFMLLYSGIALADGSTLSAKGDWIYLVKTEPSVPELEAEFNRWYNDIDIPDVLAVPSFVRARRAVGLEIGDHPDVRLKEGDGSYMALYDIATRDIDKSIIDLYVAARTMNALGRSTDALRVVEANYYSRLAGDRLRAGDAGSDRYFLIQKIICCVSEAGIAIYRDWFAEEIVPALRRTEGVVAVNLFELYRIMEELTVGDDERPHLLVIHEIEAESALRALDTMKDALNSFAVSGSRDYPKEVRDSILYKQATDAISNAGAQ